ncbi:hypothetical protein BSK49_17015 [Paenibacillus odorifer]|uniref:Uncharacterized protein n=1 Tax=Paenibacillus odorifer TaxID=189426 RepID=A0ABX3GCU3_9BACL|nr:hypothetical protein [Paenibacillus odorifer]OMC99925.1 hypothetical protein BSO21_32810 [Paenibacillus odorifer]OMD86322.1 hypothetical protein BSK67_28510 [Paenibacillus odorifer]OMD87379.1 hypothetical protein BSK49_17015 [Paenibacillus odorifer]OMD93696.1 hypothetical protein BSK54_28495 [Paenibacillus odorifer]
MFKKKSAYVLPVVVLLFLSLITSASTIGTRVDAQDSDKTQHQTVYFHTIESDHGKLSGTTDEINWYQGADADRIFAERDPEAAAEIGGAPDSYYIVNDVDTLTTYPIADNATVTMQIFDHTGNMDDLDINWNESITLQQFMDQFNKTDVIDLSQFPYHITIQDGVITSIVQQYIP